MFTSYSRISLYAIVFKPFVENEIDGESFLELTAEDVKGLLPSKLGTVKKICRLITRELAVSIYIFEVAIRPAVFGLILG